MVIFIPQDPLWICYSFSTAGGSNKTIKTTNIGSAKNRNVLYNCTKNNMVQRKKVGRLTKTREPDEEMEAVSFWMPTFTLRIVVIQIHWAVNLLTLILNFLVTIYSFLCLGGEVLCQIFMGLSCEFQCEHLLWQPCDLTSNGQTSSNGRRFLEFNILTCLGYAALWH